MNGNENGLTNNSGNVQNDFFQWGNNTNSSFNGSVNNNNYAPNSSQLKASSTENVQFTFDNNQPPPNFEIPSFNFNFDNSLFPNGSENSNKEQNSFSTFNNFGSFENQNFNNENTANINSNNAFQGNANSQPQQNQFQSNTTDNFQHQLFPAIMYCDPIQKLGEIYLIQIRHLVK